LQVKFGAPNALKVIPSVMMGSVLPPRLNQ